ncbi:putative leucine-rich repeat receptor-like serine/threonine-protein kinase [Tripterygium wilfordii]|uniref:non-specific serine/threonine protein kinase n=1 Tax=Tripterygium wilfordii TaxID=458696 RepID=A0A7J7CYC9_TRIWF|nr:putative leucine-rich repeat receptor-like serine/threonine-protein kinase [Tripterygium wilfordii]
MISQRILLGFGTCIVSNMAFTRTIFLLLLQYFVLTSVHAASGHHRPPHFSLQTDKETLLAFKKVIKFDPNSTLANWVEAFHVCNFTGVICNRYHHRVANLSLNSKGLVGMLPSFISNLTGLRALELANNHFSGNIPSEFSSLQRLLVLRLEMNNLNGPIPESFAFLSNLTLVTLMDNNLNGSLSPSFFSNCTLLRIIDLSDNFFTGTIPKEIGNCAGLWTLNLYNNQFTGELPLALINTSLSSIDVEYNHLSGQLPSSLVEKLPKLYYLHLSYNNMVSHDNNTNLHPFFTALGNFSSVEELELAGMGLGGKLTQSIGKLVNLKTLLLQENKIFGSIPAYIANLSSLNVLNLTSNFLNGTISSEISRLPNLQQLFLSHNFFNAEIQAALGHVPRLGLLDLSNNKFYGTIPETIGNLLQAKYIFLNNNLLSGKIPPMFGQCRNLDKLDLSYNRLTGIIPPEISGMHEIRIFINLSHNQLEGSLPLELSKLENILEIDLSSNKLNGSIFPQISSCIALRAINLSHNYLQKALPDSLGDLKNLESFDVSVNQLSGKIPASLEKSRTLTFLNLSFNDFMGMIPSGGIYSSVTNLSFLGNRHLCGEVSGMRKCPQKINKVFIIFISVISGSAFVATICCLIAFHRIKVQVSSGKSEEIQTAEKATQAELMHNIPRITHKELLEATRGFDEPRLIGTGSYGRVYKGILQDGTPIAVKVLHLQSGNSTKSFNRECQVLKRIRHRNLIRIITACSLPDFKALVLPYMANGSLDSRLYPHSSTGIGSGSSDLSLIQRLNICSDIAEGMAYLHHHSPVKVIHCDLKPSNVLLNDDMTALVSDFGISRLVMTAGGNGGVVENLGNSTANLLCGSIGYIAPGTEIYFPSATAPGI